MNEETYLMMIKQNTIMKRLIRILALIAVVFAVMPAHAVLKEKDLNNSLAVLRHELTTYHREQQDRLLGSQQRNKMIISSLKDIMMRSSQNSLMLYSQKTDYVFDLTYACNEATKQYQEFQKSISPFKDYVSRSNSDIARYDSLIDVLSRMPVSVLSDKARVDRNVCLTLAVNIRRMLIDNNEALKENMMWYEYTEKRLRGLNDYANKRYREIQTNIFQNGGDNYIKTLMQINWRLLEARAAVAEKYTPTNMVKSQWDVKWIAGLFMTILAYSLLALVFNYLCFRIILTWLLRRGHVNWFNLDTFVSKRGCIIITASVVTLAIALGIVRMTWQQNFLAMASNLLIEYLWLLAVILISLLIRVEPELIKSVFRVYSPLIVIGFIVIVIRIVLIPTDLVEIFLPPILLACALWQWNVIKRNRGKIPRFDRQLTYISLVIFVMSVLSAWLGYTLLSVQMLIWWIMQMTCILTIICVRNWLTSYGTVHGMEQKTIDKAWMFRLLYDVLIPSMVVLSVIISIYWAAGVFNLTKLTKEVFFYKFVDTTYLSANLFSVGVVVILWFIFNYINHTSKAFVMLYLRKKDETTAESRSVMFFNVLQVLVWGIWLLLSLAIMHINNTWFVVVSGGLSTGVGFAMKDILENIYYGISLMMGRIKIGDYIECDGTRGKVSCISYTSTMIEATDGSVIAFQNSQLFTKNYKNMTKNHGYELDILEVGVAYGSNVDFVRKILIEAIDKLDCIDHSRKPRVVLKEFGDSSINLKILVWVPVLTQYVSDGEIMECVYNTLNINNVEIPFPQREITFRHATSEEEKQLGNS